MHHALIGENLVNKPVLNVDTSRVAAREIADQFFVPRRCTERIFSEYIKEPLGPWLQTRRCELFRILLRLA